MQFTLENGTNVTVGKQDNGSYHFSVTPTQGATQSFTYREGEHTKAEWDKLLDFDQLDALREFWLKTDAV